MAEAPATTNPPPKRRKITVVAEPCYKCLLDVDRQLVFVMARLRGYIGPHSAVLWIAHPVQLVKANAVNYHIDSLLAGAGGSIVLESDPDEDSDEA